MREAIAEDQVSPLTMPLFFKPAAIGTALAALPAMDRNNRIWLAAAAAVTPLIGSALSVMVWCALLWAVYSLAASRFTVARDRFSVRCALAAGAFGFVHIAVSLATGGIDNFGSWVGTFIFFAPLFLISRFRLTDPHITLDLFVLASGFSVIAAAPMVAFEVIVLDDRASAFSGNPGILSAMSLLFGSIGALNMTSPRIRRRWLGMVCYLAMVFCVVASGMRGVWLVLPVVTAILFWAVVGGIPRTYLHRSLAAAAAVLIALTALSAETVANRIGDFRADIALIRESQNYDSSTGQRILMLNGGWQAFLEAPVTGHGVGSAMAALADHVPEENREQVLEYTHPHNGYLAALLNAGVIGLLTLVVLLFAPAALAIASPRDRGWRLRVAIGSILTATFVISGSTGIMFRHDVMDSAFIATLSILISAVAPDRNQETVKRRG